MTVKVSKPAINVREELADLRKPTGIAGEAMLRAETPQEQFNLIGAGRRNWIINGDFQVSQRGDYTSATSLTTSAAYYVDRWAAIIFAGNNGTIQKVTNQTLPNGRITDSLKLVSNVASGQYALWQWVEDYKAFRGQEATLSFWYKSNCNQSFNYYTYAAQTHVALPSTNGQWVYFTHTRKHETNATGMRIEFYPQAITLPSSAYIEVAQVQLELGSCATPFEHRSYGEELALCQRYYCRYVGNGTNYGPAVLGCFNNSTECIFVHKHIVPMRSAATLGFSATSDFDLEPFDEAPSSLTVFSHNGTDFITLRSVSPSSRTQGFACVLTLDTTGYIEFDAEL